MITIIHYKGGYKHAINSQGRRVLGNAYFVGRQPPNFPVPALPTKVDILTGPMAGVEMSIHGWLVYIYHPVENVGEWFPFPNPREQEEFFDWLDK